MNRSSTRNRTTLARRGQVALARGLSLAVAVAVAVAAQACGSLLVRPLIRWREAVASGLALEKFELRPLHGRRRRRGSGAWTYDSRARWSSTRAMGRTAMASSSRNSRARHCSKVSPFFCSPPGNFGNRRGCHCPCAGRRFSTARGDGDGGLDAVHARGGFCGGMGGFQGSCGRRETGRAGGAQRGRGHAAEQPAYRRVVGKIGREGNRLKSCPQKH